MSASSARKRLSSALLEVAPRRPPGILQRRCFAQSHSSSSDSPRIDNVSEDEIARAKQYCSNLLRQYDTPSYTLTPFIPRHAQSAYLALRALNVSLAQVADTTSATVVGSMRMQFWRDAITRSLSLNPPKEPIAILLSYAAATLASRGDEGSNLSKPWLMKIVNEREKYLHNPPYPDIAALETYAENTYSTLMYLTLSALPLHSVTADHLASHIGKAQGITAVLRGIPLLAFPQAAKHHSNQALGGVPSGATPQGAVTLPLDIMVEAGVREDEVLRKGSGAHGLRDAVFAVATRANDHLITAREMLKNVRAGRDVGHDFEHAEDEDHQYSRRGDSGLNGQKEEVERGFGVFLHAVSTQMWLDRLQKYDFDVFEPELRRGDWKLPLRAYWAYSRKQF